MPAPNGAKWRGPKTLEGKARSAQNALKHGMRAQKHVVLPQEDATEFAALEAALLAELAPVGALQLVLARRVAVAAWRLARADRLEAELFAERGFDGASPGVAMIRDGNGTRSLETLLRYRGAALAEFWRALRTLKALQAEQAAGQDAGADILAIPPTRTRPPAAGASCPRPNEPEAAVARRLQYLISGRPEPGGALHEPPAPWLPNEPESAFSCAAPGGSAGSDPTGGASGPSDCQARLKRPMKDGARLERGDVEWPSTGCIALPSPATRTRRR